jgi:gas vesicle protein GvpL/GvpF
VIGLYAIAQGAPQGTVGARGEPLRIAVRGALEAVYGDAPPPLSAEALYAHEAAVRRIADAADACLPARFGASAEDETALSAALATREAELLEALLLVRGREQMTLRVHGAPAFLPAASGPGTRYLEERRRASKLPELEPLRSALSGLVRTERVEPHAEPGLLASVYHLIDRGDAARYRRIVEATELDGLRVNLSGPWPAWSFAPELAP